MKTSFRQTPFLSEIASGEPIPHAKLAYFQERLRNRLYHFVVSKFLEEEKAGRLTRAELARRIHKRPEQLTRWLNTPGNWTFATLSDLLLGICGEELEPHAKSVLNRPQRNFVSPTWIKEASASDTSSPAATSAPHQARWDMR